MRVLRGGVQVEVLHESQLWVMMYLKLITMPTSNEEHCCKVDDQYLGDIRLRAVQQTG